MSKSTAEIRQAFLDFFHSKGHQVVASSSLVPHNDPTLLFTNAGMNQFKDVFLGLDKRNYSRATTSQRCVRAGGKHNDLENVGYTARHHTFFEMLGNFSFGDYFKHDAIQFAWELLTSEKWFALPKERLWVTVYESDDEAYEIWEKEVGIPRERIIRIGDNKGAPYASDNFWQMGDTGPCGPCTEIFYDHGDHIWGRGYVLRRIIRRAVRHGNMLGAKETFFYKLVGPLIDVMGSAGEDLKRQQAQVEQVLKTEEEQFARTLERGLALLDEELAKLSGDTLDGETAFRLYDTYGFPVDLTADVCRERNIKVDEAGGHIGKLAAGSLKVGDAVQADVDEARRARIRLNHSATHLMHAALRQVLGTHVSQKGSLVNDKVLRFDFSHNEAMKPEEIRAVEDLVNTQIRRNLPIETNIMDLEAAKAKGAMALFGEKYDERVRVLSMGDFSTELCGGTHASRTGDIGLFRIISESGTAAGVRRIEAVTGEGAIATVHADSDRLSEVAHLLKGDSNNLADKVRSVLERTRQLEKELQQLKEQAAAQESANLSSKAIDVNGVKLLVSELSGVEPKMLRTMVDDLKNQLGSTIIVLATVVEGKVSLIAGVSKDVTDRVKAGELIGMVAQQVGGKGGGRPDMAQAGGTDAAALPAALASVKGWVSAKLQ